MDYLKSYRNVFDQNIILLFKGELTFDLVTSLIATLEERLRLDDETYNHITKKFYNVATECIQNLFYYLEEMGSETQINTFDSKSALIMISARKRFYSILTGNYLPASKSKEVKDRIDEINQLPPEQLRELYTSTLKKGNLTNGIRGLGFIDIARKTDGEKLRYKLQNVNDKVDYFTLQIKLPRDL